MTRSRVLARGSTEKSGNAACERCWLTQEKLVRQLALGRIGQRVRISFAELIRHEQREEQRAKHPPSRSSGVAGRDVAQTSCLWASGRPRLQGIDCLAGKDAAGPASGGLKGRSPICVAALSPSRKTLRHDEPARQEENSFA